MMNLHIFNITKKEKWNANISMMMVIVTLTLLTQLIAYNSTGGGNEEYTSKKTAVIEDEEEFKGADFEKIQFEKQYVPTLLDDDNFDF